MKAATMIAYFDYALHDRLGQQDLIAAISESAGVEIDAELAVKIGRPFYEVVLACTLDTETGAIAILSAVARDDQ